MSYWQALLDEDDDSIIYSEKDDSSESECDPDCDDDGFGHYIHCPTGCNNCIEPVTRRPPIVPYMLPNRENPFIDNIDIYPGDSKYHPITINTK